MDMLDDLARYYAFLNSVEESRLQSRLSPEQRAALYILRSFELMLGDGKDWDAALCVRSIIKCKRELVVQN